MFLKTNLIFFVLINFTINLIVELNKVLLEKYQMIYNIRYISDLISPGWNAVWFDGICRRRRRAAVCSRASGVPSAAGVHVWISSDRNIN